ncbi:hypothetical protein BDR04DRAFT_1164542 [Suillus decipiens]|nr:hypothetical protein BDR04DRAFT_1164542 [Suillus decipiens]
MLTKEELWRELQCMYEQNGALVQTTQVLTAQLDTMNAHCTMAQWALAQSRLELENVKKKKQPRKFIKLRARFVTHPELEEDFNKVEEEQHKKTRPMQRNRPKRRLKMKLKTFDALWRKDDFITLASALKISRDGTVEELRARIKEFLADAENQHFADNPHFSALFQMGKTHSKNSVTLSSTGQVNSAMSQDNGTTSSNAVAFGNHPFTAPAHAFNSHYPPHLMNQPYFHQFYANAAPQAPSYPTMQNNNPSGGPIASSSNLHRQPQAQYPYNVHGLPTYPLRFYDYSTNNSHPCT